MAIEIPGHFVYRDSRDSGMASPFKSHNFVFHRGNFQSEQFRAYEADNRSSTYWYLGYPRQLKFFLRKPVFSRKSNLLLLYLTRSLTDLSTNLNHDKVSNKSATLIPAERYIAQAGITDQSKVHFELSKIEIGIIHFSFNVIMG